MKYKLILDSCGNIDKGENPYKQVEGAYRTMIECNSIEECSIATLDYCKKHNLGYKNLECADVFTINNEYVGYISYNGKYWSNK